MAQTVPGVLLVSELQTGSVEAVQQGGDLTGTPRFAVGLEGPVGLCVGPNHDIFVAEYEGGKVRIITAGGDLSTGDAFATIPHPIALACSSTSVYVSSPGVVVDITSGGDFTSPTPFATIDASIFALLLDGDGKLWAGGQTGVWDISEGGEFDSADRYATDEGALPFALGMIDTELYVARSSGNVVAVTMGATLDTATAFATVPNLIGFTASDGHAFATAFDAETESLSVFDISAGGDFTAASPLATGLGAAELAGMLYIHGCGDGEVQEAFGEECDDGDDNSDTLPDACRTNCHSASCGDAVVDKGEDCDEGDANDDSGACDADCRCADDADSDGTCDDEDECDEDADKTEPGDCGCGIADTDTDSDGTPDCNDSSGGMPAGETCEPAPVLVETTTLAAGDADCPKGGMRTATGADDGDPSGTACDGVLQSGEIDSMEPTCSTEVTAKDDDDDSGSCRVHAFGQGQSGLGPSLLALAAVWLRRRRARA